MPSLLGFLQQSIKYRCNIDILDKVEKTDAIAYGVLLEAERSGFSVPRDLSVVGFDDLDWSRHLRPSLTTIQVPTEATWQRAGEYLVRYLAGEQTIIHHEVDYALIVRESTAPPPPSPKQTR